MGVPLVWFPPAVVVAPLIARGIWLADAHPAVELTLTTADLPEDVRPAVDSSPR